MLKTKLRSSLEEDLQEGGDAADLGVDEDEELDEDEDGDEDEDWSDKDESEEESV